MPRGRKRIVSPPPPPPPRPPPGSQPNNSTGLGSDGARASAGVWWEGASTGSPAASSPRVFHTDKPSDLATVAEFSTPAIDPQSWGKDYRPVGGFLNYLQNSSSFPFPQHAPHQPPMSQNPSNFLFPQHAPHQPNMSQNLHYVGGTSYYTPSLAPQPLAANGSPSPSLSKACSPRSQSFIHIDSGDDDGEGRTEKRLIWTQEEDVRLMSAWLNNSNDPIMGNNKKNDKYWGDVANSYNSTTPKNRRRLAKQAKDRWHKLNKWVNEFQCSWLKASRIYASGQSDDQLMDKAHRIYGEDYGGQFLHMSTWKAVRDQPKWHAYNKKLNAGEAGDHTSSPTNIEDIQRPIGTKAAKADRNDKGKPKAKTVEVEELDKYLNMQAETNQKRSEAMELQKRISAEKLEVARLAHLAAKENKEAKMVDKESKMLETYMTLITHDTSNMPDDVKGEHMEAIRCMRMRLFANVDCGRGPKLDDGEDEDIDKMISELTKRLHDQVTCTVTPKSE